VHTFDAQNAEAMQSTSVAHVALQAVAATLHAKAPQLVGLSGAHVPAPSHAPAPTPAAVHIDAGQDASAPPAPT
jgi:hypothetical protein